MAVTSSQHIVIICSYLHVPGGYEKMLVSTANLFSEKGFRVTLLILDEPADIFYPLNENIQVVQKKLTFGNALPGNPLTRKTAMAKDLLTLRKLLHQIKPDIVIGSEYNFAIAAILVGSRRYAKVFSWEHHHYGALKLNRFWRILLNLTYPLLDAVITLNEDERKHYSKLNKGAVAIPNFITPSLIFSDKPHPDNYILTVTRFNHIKGFDLLLDVAESVFKQNHSIKWKIIGYGEQQEKLLRFIEKKKLNDRFIFIPATNYDITEHYQQADFFVLTSRNECFPLVLLEAQSAGLPIIAFDCETGPRHIIQHNRNGLLIEKENTEQMAQAIIDLWINKTQQKEMSISAIDTVRQFYPDAAFQRWNKLFQKGKF